MGKPKTQELTYGPQNWWKLLRIILWDAKTFRSNLKHFQKLLVFRSIIVSFDALNREQHHCNQLTFFLFNVSNSKINFRKIGSFSYLFDENFGKFFYCIHHFPILGLSLPKQLKIMLTDLRDTPKTPKFLVRLPIGDVKFAPLIWDLSPLRPNTWGLGEF